MVFYHHIESLTNDYRNELISVRPFIEAVVEIVDSYHVRQAAFTGGVANFFR